MKGEVALRRHEIIMFYKSTRNSALAVDSATAISQGISADGGLFVPSEIPSITMDEIRQLSTMRYADRAAYIFAKYLTDFTEAEIHHCTDSAYNTKAFETDAIAEISHLFDGTYMLELWHGPTCAFKDMALQVLPYFLTTAVKKKALNKKIVILGVCAIKGNFDDCQNGVKAIFTDPQVKQQLDQAGLMFSSANSINWGRLLPQIVYYISAYATLAADGEINFGGLINVVVPTGNFGNILAAYYAKKMGLPIKKLICASNINKVLTDFINTGVYNRNREFFATCSPSMDILISSNLERLLYLLAGEDDAQIREWFGALAKEGTYTVTDAVKQALQADFCAGFCDDADTKKTIHEIYEKYSYTCDTHTAVAVKVYKEYKEKTGDTTKTLIASTASPYKFSASVLEALEGAPSTLDEYAMIDALAERSKLEIPAALAQLKNKPERFTDSIARTDMKDYVLRQLGL